MVIDKIYEISTADLTGEYSFDPKSPEAMDLIYGIISFCAGNSDAIPKFVKWGLTGKDVKDAVDTFADTEETASKLSYFIQQYSTEGQEEDAWKKFITATSFLGTIFGFLGLLSNASVEENRYQIVQYNQRKAFLNSAKDEIVRIKELQSNVKEEHLETEINYLRFLKKQLKMITEEIRLNKERDLQQLNEIRFYTSQHASSKDWKDTRSVKSSANFHNIDYHKLFEEQK